MPMLITLFGIVTLIRLSHSKNALSPMVVTPSEITTFSRFLASSSFFHGASMPVDDESKSDILPVPLIVSIFVSVSYSHAK